jgi:catechol 2,3-dioxygenase-like lactoylglutathione lyase family enzyme
MRKKVLLTSGLLISFVLVSYISINYPEQPGDKFSQPANTKTSNEENLKLGAFSMSLNVKDLKASRAFYENLGFTVFGGGMEKNYLIMKNGNTLIGLFYGMFEGNMLTFNPGWDENAKNFDPFDDVRKIQKQLKNKGISIAPEADEKTTGPAFIMLSDPDGNKILIDQHR